MNRIHASVLCCALLACVDQNDDTQSFESASAPSLPLEPNTILEVLPLDVASCFGDSNHPASAFETYRDAATFAVAYRAARPGAAQVPSVDFTRHVVVGAFLGQQPHCGAEIAITGATLQSERVEVNVLVAESGCGGDDAHSYPYAFARLDRFDKPYVPLERHELAACP